jgi:hydroxymethylglutaryl-CoA lyase
MSLPKFVKIVEVSPRDGLQSEKEPISTDLKVALVNRLSAAGFLNIEATAFVSPKWTPQMADASEVMARIGRRPGTTYSVLTPNMKGFEAALAAGADEVVIFAAASEAFSQKNIHCSIAESIERFEPVAQAARQAGIRLRGALSCALGCPYEGVVPISAAVEVAKRLAALGCDEIDVSDTIGVGTPQHTQQVMQAVAEVIDVCKISGHFHDTYGQALANILASMEVGISIFHASVAGLGGCPYAKGASGNVATEDVLFMLRGMGIETGIDFDAVVDTGQWIASHLKRPSGSRAGNAIAANKVEK